MSNVKWVVLWVCFLFYSHDVFCQEACSFTSDEHTVLVGQPFRLKLTLTTIENNPVKTIDFTNIKKSQNALFQKDSALFEIYADIELLSSDQWQNVKIDQPFEGSNLPFLTIGNRLVYENTFTFAIYNPGIFNIYPPEFGFGLVCSPDSIITIEVIVPPLDSLNQLSKDTLYPIKPIIIEPTHWTDYLLVVYILMGIIFLYILAKYIQKKPKTLLESSLQILKKSPHEIALEKILELEKNQAWKIYTAKDFQSKISYIFREYVENRYKILALEMSTTDCIHALQHEIGLDSTLLVATEKILNQADLIKFAKANALDDIHINSVENVKTFILSTKQDEE
ncbi:MAG: hypothetical protein WAT79_17055 [Saprospiraceae bacterium]